MHKISYSHNEQSIIDALCVAASSQKVEAYLVGGFVRDKLLGRPTNDIDVVCVGSGIEFAKAFSKVMNGHHKVNVFPNFGTAQVVCKDYDVEFVGARKESYRSESRKPIVENGTIEDDQQRRDFTINALAISLNNETKGELVDPFNGIDDLKNKRIVTPLAPDQTFSDDPLRMLRAIRFATQLNFKIDPKTLASIAEQKERISIISAERIITELTKIMQSKVPSIGFEYLFDTGLLALILPTIHALHGVEVKNGIGHKDNFYHTIKVLDNVAEMSDNIWLRWAALYHDVGKPKSKRFDEKLGWTFHGHDMIGANMIKKIFKRLKLPLDHRMHYVAKMVRLHLRPISLTKTDITDSAVRRMIFDSGEDVDDLMLLCRADITSKNEFKVKRYQKNYDILLQKIEEIEEKDRLRNWQPPISGEEIMAAFGLKPCKTVGTIKLAIREAILNGDIENNYEDAKLYMIETGKIHGLEYLS